MIPMVRHRKLLRDNIQGIRKPAIRRLLIASGCGGVAKDTYDIFRGLLMEELRTIMKGCSLYVVHARRKTYDVEDLHHYQAHVNFRPPPRTNDEVLNTLKKIATHGDGFFFNRASFGRLITEVAQDYDPTGFRLSKEFRDEVQYHAEFKLRLVASIAAKSAKVYLGKGRHVITVKHLWLGWELHNSRGLFEDPVLEARASAKEAIRVKAARSRKAAKAAKAGGKAKTATKKKAGGKAKAKVVEADE